MQELIFEVSHGWGQQIKHIESYPSEQIIEWWQKMPKDGYSKKPNEVKKALKNSYNKIMEQAGFLNG